MKLFRSLYSRFVHSTPMSATLEDQKSFFESLKTDNTAIELTYGKYKCRKYMSDGSIQRILIAILSLVLFFPLLIYYVVRGWTVKPDKQPNVDAVIKQDRAFPSIDDLIPEAVFAKYPNTIKAQMKTYRKGQLDFCTVALLTKLIIRYPFRFYMHLMCMLHLAECCRIIHTYHPKAIISYAEERVFAKPLVTEYCHMYKVWHEAFMHGECYYQIDKGLLYYDCYYVWDEHYVDLFNELKCRCAYEIYTPARFFHELKPVSSWKDTEYFLTYYLGDESTEVLYRIQSLLHFIEEKGLKCKVRKHPRCGDHALIEQLFCGCVESCSIEESLNTSYCAASLWSTVLDEAYYSGRIAVVDDSSDVERYHDAKTKGLSLLNRPHWLVSELIDCIKREDLSALQKNMIANREE